VGHQPQQAHIVEPNSSLYQTLVALSNAASPILAAGRTIQLSPDQSHYLSTVLRLFKKKSAASETRVRLFGGAGSDWIATVESLSVPSKQRRRDDAGVVATCLHPVDPTSGKDRNGILGSCWLAICTPSKKDRLRWLLEKTTELGTAGWILLESDFSEVKDTNVFDKLSSHVLEATEQCERPSLPTFVSIGDPSNSASPRLWSSLSTLLNHWTTEAKDARANRKPVVRILVCRERTRAQSMWQALNDMHQDEPRPVVMILVGPEGGWSRHEEEMLDRLERDYSGFVSNISLGPLVLRAETAAMAAMATFAMYQDHRRRGRWKQVRAWQ
jgi:16S rRNA (uracil1498-N3)-methyltransferase